MRAQFIKVKDLVDKFANESADVVGVVDKVEPAATITTKDGREVMALGDDGRRPLNPKHKYLLSMHPPGSIWRFWLAVAWSVAPVA